MPEYDVQLTLTIEADSEDDAFAKASNFDYSPFQLFEVDRVTPVLSEEE